jgi:RND family efflux transporter MFP subunit
MKTDLASLWSRIPRRAALGAGAVAALFILLLYLQGSLFGHKVEPGTVSPPLEAARAQRVRVVQREVEDEIEWPATVTSRSVANVAPKVMARVLDVRVIPGTTVTAGEVIATLDDRELGARQQQAAAAVSAAEAQLAQAEADLRRARMLFEKQATSQQDLDAVETRAKSARAQAAQARDALNEVQVMRGETNVRAPFDGVIAARFVDPGDMAVPGKPLVVMHDPDALRLEVHLAERCSPHLAVGSQVVARFGAPAAEVTAKVDEIAPMADPRSRTVLVKAALPPHPDLRPGTFATVNVPCGNHVARLIPASAVKRTGQLESARVVIGDEVRTRNIRTGRQYGDQVEVLSGLGPDDTVLVEP